MRGRGERFEDATLLALKMEEGVLSQGMQVPLEAKKGKETDSPLRTPKGIQLCQHTDFIISDLQNYKTINMCCTEALILQ